MKINSRSKGQRAEREVVKILQPVIDELSRETGVSTPQLQRNTIQSDKGGFDLVGLDWLALEVKHCETFQLEKWWDQTLRQAKGKVPVLFYRRNQISFRVRMRGTVWVDDIFHDCVCDISLDDFVKWFRLKLKSEFLKI